MRDAEALALSVDQNDSPPAGIPPGLHALWLARKGRWREAHDLCQEIPGPSGAWIHALLHREEGDYQNACYWYARANRKAPEPGDPLEEEWFAIARELCEEI